MLTVVLKWWRLLTPRVKVNCLFCIIKINNMNITTLVLNMVVSGCSFSLLIIFVLKKQNLFNDLSTVILRRPVCVFRDGSKPLTRWVQPLKMEQYFGEFESAFSETWMSFIAPVFPALSSVSIWFSVAMIVLKFALGIALYRGTNPNSLPGCF